MTSKGPYRFSVIVPLESPRGQAEACLHGWTQGQTFPRDRYEVLAIAHRSSLRASQEWAIRSRLAPPDRLLLHDQSHDIALAARGAREALGDLLFFTESHVLPEPETLARADEAIRARPGLAGLSCRSVRVTHNRLGEAMADMYEPDIRYGMEQHPWRRILDQCYIARREPYFEAGGFRPEFGHFAEWLLAAQMYRLGYHVGYAPEVTLQHFYSGCVRELIEFAEDFALGEMRYHAEAAGDLCQPLFDEVPDWFGRHRWRVELARAARRLAFREWWTRGAGHRRWTVASLRVLMATASRAAFGLRPVMCRAWLDLWAARATLHWRLLSAGGQASRRAALVRLNEAVVRLARVRFLGSWLTSRPQGSESEAATTHSLHPWEATRADAFTSVGFHGLEHWNGKPFRWTEPVAMLEVPLDATLCQISIEWLPVRPIADLRIYVNGSAKPVSLEAGRGVARFRQSSSGWARVAWVCAPWSAPDDWRVLGLPVWRVSWTAGGPGPGQ